MLIAFVLLIALAVAILASIPTAGRGDQSLVQSTLRTATGPITSDDPDTGREVATSFAERVMVPLLEHLSTVALRFTPKGYLDNLRRRLRLAGRPQDADFEQFLVGRLLSLVAVPIVLILVGVAPIPHRSSLLLFLIVSLLLILGPEVLLNRRITARQESIRRQLADLIDILNIGVQAGLSFEQALSRTAVAVPGELSEEFARMLGETRVGASRRDAFQGVIERTEVPELRGFLLALGQAEEFGISIVQILASQSIEMRTARRQRAQEKAQKAPVKMLFPLVFCILPALFIVVVGPAAIEIYRTVIK